MNYTLHNICKWPLNCVFIISKNALCIFTYICFATSLSEKAEKAAIGF